MRRLLRFLLPVIVFVPLIVVAAPASATPPETPTCAGAYDFTLSAPMGAPADPDVTASFSMTRSTGIGALCGLGMWPPTQFGGSLTGNCGAASGAGGLPNGDSFEIYWTDTTLTITDWGPQSSGVFAITVPMDCTGTTFDAVGVIGSFATLHDACFGAGTMYLSSPFVATQSTTSNFTYHLSVLGLCASFTSMSATGTVTGNCEFAIGQGVTSDGAPFDLLWVENHVVVVGSAIGIVNVSPDAFWGSNCVSGARYFLVNGVMATLR